MADLRTVNMDAGKGAIFSGCRRYRYMLWRRWSSAGGYVMFVGLNPSTADEAEDDPTIRRCIGFARAWGYGGLVMTNLFAWCGTDPACLTLPSVRDPIGPENDRHLRHWSLQARMTVVAWGARGALHDRDVDALSLFDHPYCLGTTKAGLPRHPLYVRRDVQPVFCKRRPGAEIERK